MRLIVAKKDAPILATIKSASTNYIPDETTQQLLTTTLPTRSSSLQSLFDNIPKIKPRRIEICHSRVQESVTRDFEDTIFVGKIKGLTDKLRKKTENKVIKKMREDYEKTKIYPVSGRELPLDNHFDNKILCVLNGDTWTDVYGDASAHYRDYVKCNEVFCTKIQKIYKEGDVVWIFDPALWLLPKMLRIKIPKIKIAVSFLNGFPPGTTFENFSHTKEILESLLNSTYLEFECKLHRNNFLRCCEKVLEVAVEKKQIVFNCRKVTVGINSLALKSDLPSKIAAKATAKKYGKEVRKKNEGKKVVVSVTKCSQTGTLINIYKAIDAYFTTNEKNTIFYCVEIPGGNYVAEERAEVCRMEEYLKMKYGHEDVVIRKTGIEDYKYYGLLETADCGIFMDHNHLPILDFLKIHKKSNATILVGTGNVVFRDKLPSANQNNSKEVAEKIKILLDDPTRKMRDSIKKTKKKFCKKKGWFAKFKAKVEGIEEEIVVAVPEITDGNEIIERFKVADTKALVLDYDGTLADIVDDPADATTTPELMDSLERLNNVCKVVILTGRSKHSIEKFITSPDIDIYAEHGIFKRISGEWSLCSNLKCGWKEPTKDIMSFYEERTPGSKIEEKLTSLCFHYRNANKVIHEKQSKDLKNSLKLLLKDFKNINIGDGKCIVEVKQSTVDKGTILNCLSEKYDVILCAGDDVTDENMFKAGKYKDNVASILVGDHQSFAKNSMESPAAFRDFIVRLAKTIAGKEGEDVEGSKESISIKTEKIEEEK